MPPSIAPWIAALVGRPRWRAYLVRNGGEAIGGGLLYHDGDWAWLGMGATAPAHRGRGVQGAVMARRIRDAIAAGARHIATETGDPVAGERNDSLANMVRSGFRKVCSRENWRCARGAA
jgi:hypothetical protein